MIEELKKNIYENNSKEVLKLIEIIGNEKNELALPILLDLFETTDDSILRNKIALALSDIGNSMVVEPIIKMIFNPKAQRSRGTLIYSLNNFECSQYTKLFINLLSDRSLEVSREAFSLIESNHKNITNADKNDCLKSIAEEIEFINDRLELLYETYELFSDKKEET